MKLCDIFSSINDTILFAEPGGNYGDTLIYAGAHDLANRANLKYQSTSREAFLSGQHSNIDFIYMHGGGGLTNWGSNLAWNLLRGIIKTPAKHIIIGPQTLVNIPDFIKFSMQSCLAERKCERLTFYTRELTSYKLLADMNIPNIELYLDEDTAFHFEYKKHLNLVPPQNDKYPLFVVRDDLESSSSSPANIHSNAVITDPVNSAKSFDHWVRIHALSSQVVANRTHSAILSAIIGKPTTIYGGHYHKNSSIFEFSLKKRGVSWLDNDQLTPGRPVRYPRINRASLPNWLADSYKVRRTTLFINELRNYINGMPIS